MKEILTTGEAAKICNVSLQTIIRCFDRGDLKGYTVPGSKFRRIPQHELIRFMRKSGLTIPCKPTLESANLRIQELEEAMAGILDTPFALERIHAIAQRAMGHGFTARQQEKAS